MKRFLKHIVLCVCGLWLIQLAWAGERQKITWTETVLHGEIIQSFRNSLGFTYLPEKDKVQKNIDSLLSVLEAEKQYDAYFELRRISIKSKALRGETRLAIAESDRMYSKAVALDHSLGRALALNVIGEVYALTGRDKEAGDAYQKALTFFDVLNVDPALIKILLVELTEYYLRIGYPEGAGPYIERLNKMPFKTSSETEQAIRFIFNAYYQISKGDTLAASQYLNRVSLLSAVLSPAILRHFFIVKAMYLTKIGSQEEALKMYEDFFQTKDIYTNHALYVIALRNKADLYRIMGRTEEAYRQYKEIYDYIKSTFEKNYPKEIDQLTTRFQAEQLAYQNERSRHLSMRCYTIGIVLCVLLLLVFSFLSWKKIFRLRLSKQKLEVMKGKAENAIKRKNLFLSNMSHEVRTPLNAIVGFSGLLASEDMELDTESEKEYCEIIKVNSQQLLNLVNDILDFSDFEGENIKFNIRENDAVKICKDVVETIRASYQLQVELSFMTELTELFLETDDARLRQVLINLLVNATKFTKEGSIVLKLEISPENKEIALFSVTDTGCGIPLEKQKLIFERFEKLNDFVQGSGLGLSICQLIVKHIQGKLWVDSHYTQGARFCFTHPLKYKSPL